MRTGATGLSTSRNKNNEERVIKKRNERDKMKTKRRQPSRKLGTKCEELSRDKRDSVGE